MLKSKKAFTRHQLQAQIQELKASRLRLAEENKILLEAVKIAGKKK